MKISIQDTFLVYTFATCFNMSTFPVLWFDVDILKQVKKVNTRNVYMFEGQYIKWVACDCANVKEVHNFFMHNVKDENNSRVHLFTFDGINEIIV